MILVVHRPQGPKFRVVSIACSIARYFEEQEDDEEEPCSAAAAAARVGTSALEGTTSADVLNVVKRARTRCTSLNFLCRGFSWPQG